MGGWGLGTEMGMSGGMGKRFFSLDISLENEAT